MQMAEIIEFKKKINEASFHKNEAVVDKDIEIITDAVLSSSLDMLIRVGYDLERDFYEILPSIILIKESITSLQMKLKGEDHFLQDFAEKSFIITDD